MADCGVKKPGWYCSREAGHEGPCACWPVSHDTMAIRERITEADMDDAMRYEFMRGVLFGVFAMLVGLLVSRCAT